MAGRQGFYCKAFLFIIILAKYGVIVEKPEKLLGKKQFTSEKDINNGKKKKLSGEGAC